MHVRSERVKDTEDLGRRLAQAVLPGLRIHLSGELGSGKTTLVRGFLRGLGYTGKVKSPTYTLVEPYIFENMTVYHFDLYRIENAAELESMGYREYPGPHAICLVEWPERARAYLGEPDLEILIEGQQEYREIEIKSHSSAGMSLINKNKP
jgi:tRNA threonylcarbamoyladenosine biosynthesis protein TsaE